MVRGSCLSRVCGCCVCSTYALGVLFRPSLGGSTVAAASMGSASVRQPSGVLNAQTKLWNAVGVGLQPLLQLADDTALLGRAGIPSPILPVPHEPHAPTPTAKVDEILKSLDAHRQQWAHTNPQQRAEMLSQVLQNVMQLTPKLAKAGAQYKGCYEAGDGEEM